VNGARGFRLRAKRFGGPAVLCAEALAKTEALAKAAGLGRPAEVGRGGCGVDPGPKPAATSKA